MDGIVKDRLARPDCTRGFILDGYPRTIPQADFIEGLFRSGELLTVVVGIRVDEVLLLDRLSGRRTCPSCRKMFHVRTSPSKAGDRCDECGAGLVLRPDDSENVVRERLQVYQRDTRPLISHYQAKGLYSEVDGNGSVDDIFKSITAAVDARRGTGTTGS